MVCPDKRAKCKAVVRENGYSSWTKITGGVMTACLCHPFNNIQKYVSDLRKTVSRTGRRRGRLRPLPPRELFYSSYAGQLDSTTDAALHLMIGESTLEYRRDNMKKAGWYKNEHAIREDTRVSQTN